MPSLKKGRISKAEEAIIEANLETMSADELAIKLNRDPKSVKDFVKRKFQVGLTGNEEAAHDLRNSPGWAQLELQFSPTELDTFEYNWGRIIEQFRDDVNATEEMQVKDLIKYDLLADRCLKSNRDSLGDVAAIEALIAVEQARDLDQQDAELMFRLRQERTGLRVSQETANREFRELQGKKSAILKDMRATREQRVKNLEDSKQTLTGWVIYLMNNPDVVAEYGKEMKMMEMAMGNRKGQLAQPHVYEDGMVDQPFLNCDTVIKEEDR